MACECQTEANDEIQANNTTALRVFPEAPVTVNDDSLDGALLAYSPFVLDCWELGCRPCQIMAPKIDPLASEYKGRIVFGKLCTDYNPITVREYEVSRSPTLLIFNNSTLVHRHVGNHPKEEIENIILAALEMQ
ncbi:MAG: thioredoxin family protein [Methanothrix sp.]